MVKISQKLITVLILTVLISGCTVQQQTIELKIGETKNVQVVSQPTVIKLVKLDVSDQNADFSVYDPRAEESSKYNFTIERGGTKSIMNTYNEYTDITLNDIKTESVVITLKKGKPSGGGEPD
ncbi:MAG: hypothetical protein GTN36_00385 [Candidatus Aenigmarchaeota archaeon]|nr:hypothetical protein [Candidatus Aenigmarchaeota archaeon]